MSFVHNSNFSKDPFAKYHNRKRQHSENVCENTEDHFNKRYDFYCEEEWRIPNSADLFTEQTWKIDQFQIMKYQLNQVKGQLSQFNLQEWSQHTRARDPAGNVFRQLKKYVKPEILTQAWCKFYECISQFPIINEAVISDNKLNSFHLCEAPGAFISALNHYLATNYSDVQWDWLVNSLNPEYEGNDLSHMIPDKRLMNFTRNHWRFGSDNSGDLTKFYNHEALVSDAEKLGKILLVTADGSVDCMSNPGEQESLVEQLHFCEVVTALTVLSPGGSFVVKMFTMFESASICLLYLLYNCFETLHIFKPCTSKSGNSEVYVICLKYKAKIEFLQIREKLLTYYKNPDFNLSMFSLDAIPNKFISQIEECNMFFMSKQIKTINDNIYCFKKILPNEYRKIEEIKNAISESFICRYNIKSMDNSKYLTDRKYYNFFPELYIFTYIHESSIENILFGNDIIVEDQNIELDFIFGKKVPKVLYSEFCDINYLSRFHNSELLLSSIFMNSLLKFNIQNVDCDFIIQLNYTNNNEINLMNLFNKFFDAVHKINGGQNIIIVGSLFLTRFEVSVLFLLLYGFSSVQYYSGILILKEATLKLSTIRNIFDQINISLKEIPDAENNDFIPAILSILPNTLFRTQSYLKFLFDYNNSTLDYFFKN